MMALELHDLLLCGFSENGNGPQFYNCWNLCREVYRRAGRQLPAYNDYIKDLFERDRVIKEVRKCFFKPLNKPEYLAIVTLKLRPKCITHIGCIINKRQFIHISRTAGVNITKINDRKWNNKIEGFYRYVG